jgi:outer membrane receptor for ferrienterochelin and colicins
MVAILDMNSSKIDFKNSGFARFFLIAFQISLLSFCAKTFAVSTEPNMPKDFFEMSLEELMDVEVVSAGRHAQKISSVPATVHTITRRDIELSGATNLAEILRDVVGVTITRHPGSFPQYNAVIRGFFSDFLNERILVMIDGVPIYHPHGGGIDLGWLSLSYVEKIEIIKGPVSALYGANAFGGIVNVITQSGNKAKFFGETGVGVKIRENLDNDETVFAPYPWVSAGGHNGKIDYFVSTDGFLNSSGYMERYQGQENLDIFGKVGFQASERTRYQVSTLASRDQMRVGISNARGPMQFDMTNITGNVETKISDGYTLMLQGYFNDFRDYVRYSDNTQYYENKGRVVGGEVQNTFRIGEDNILIIGAEARQNKGLLDTFENDSETGGVKDAGYDQRSINDMGIYVQQEYLGIDRMHPVLGLRYDHSSEFGNMVSPRIGLSYQINDNVSPYFAIGKAFRAPNFNELYVEGWGKLGSPDLEPEQSTNYEIGCKGVLPDKKTRFNLSLFRHEIKDMIVLVPQDSTDPASLQEFVNSADDVTINGIEAEVSHTFSRRITPFFNISLLDTDDGSGQSLKKVPKTKLMAGINYHRNGFDVRFQMRYKSDSFDLNSNPAIASDENGHVTIEGFTTMDLFVSKTFSLKNSYRARLSVYVENITDRQYEEAFAPWIEQSTSRMPGRTFGIELRAKF